MVSYNEYSQETQTKGEDHQVQKMWVSIPTHRTQTQQNMDKCQSYAGQRWECYDHSNGSMVMP